jgi:cobalt-zinc-cadmium efflux system outer membrane protein
MNVLVFVFAALAVAGRARAQSAPPATSAPPTVPTPAPTVAVETLHAAGGDRSGVGLGMEEAVAVALTRNRELIAARLDVQTAEYDHVAARMYPNPVLSYTLGNLVLGAGNTYNVSQGAPAQPGFFSQTQQSIGVSQVIDVWAKRSARTRAADADIRVKRLELEDVLREVSYDVRSAFASIVRETYEREFAHEVKARYDDTVRLSRSRFQAGEISEADLRKIELEGLKYESGVIDADLEYEEARLALASLLGFGSAAELPEVNPNAEAPPLSGSLAELTRTALAERPDLRAVNESRGAARAGLSAAEREAYPDVTLGVAYTHSSFTVSGDNPNTLGLGVSLPLPVFDRNQANVGRARVDIHRADNDVQRLSLQIQREVAEAFGRYQRAESLLAIYRSGMLDRAETSLAVAEKSYRAGAISLLEFLEAQRTYLETRADYLRARYDHEQAAVDLAHALGKRASR